MKTNLYQRAKRGIQTLAVAGLAGLAGIGCAKERPLYDEFHVEANLSGIVRTITNHPQRDSSTLFIDAPKVLNPFLQSPQFEYSDTAGYNVNVPNQDLRGGVPLEIGDEIHIGLVDGFYSGFKVLEVIASFPNGKIISYTRTRGSQ